MHEPVLLDEVIKLLQPRPGQIVVDGTIGQGGHSERIIELIQPGGQLIGLDWDKNALSRAQERLAKYSLQLKLFCDNFAHLGVVLRGLGLTQVDAILLDLGFSSAQMDDPERGLSFQANGPLDMRLNPDAPVTAAQVVNHYPAHRLEEIIREYGEERWAKRIARGISEARRKAPITETGQLAEIICRAVPVRHSRIHPATRVFQALRIEVNQELENLTECLKDVEKYLTTGGRIAVISFHSLEDRIVKTMFRDKMKQGYFGLITKKPIFTGSEEITRNPRARSARLRVAEKQEVN